MTRMMARSDYRIPDLLVEANLLENALLRLGIFVLGALPFGDRAQLLLLLCTLYFPAET